MHLLSRLDQQSGAGRTEFTGRRSPRRSRRRFYRSATGSAARLAKSFSESGSYIPAIFFDVDAGEQRDRRDAQDPYEHTVTLLYSTGEDPQKAEQEAARAADHKEDLQVSLYEPELSCNPYW